MMEFKIFGAAGRRHSKLAALDFKKAGFGLLRDLQGKILWDKALEAKGTHKS